MIQPDVRDLARALEQVGEPQTTAEQLLIAIADAGAIVSVRDSNGVMLWASSRVSGGPALAVGHLAPEGATFWHPDGREMAIDERPVDRARLTGLTVDGAVYGVQLPGDSTMRWNQVLALPLAGGAAGSRPVLTIGFDITEAVRAIQLAEVVGLAGGEDPEIGVAA
jgi:hypothetical protein